VSETAARLLRGADRFRFVPAPDWNGEATLTYRAWDPANGLTSTHADVTTQPGFSGESLTAVVRVVPVNDRPVLDTSIARVFAADPRPVEALLAGSSDVDGGAAGIAVTRAAARGGAWEYRLGPADPWAPVPVVSTGSALLVGRAGAVRFAPHPGAVAALASFDYRAWDGSTGGAPGERRPTASTAFSKAAETATFSAGNGTPTFQPGAAPTFRPVVTGRRPVSQTLTGLVGRMTDPDPGFQRGIAVAGSTGDGTWEFSVNGGRTWHAVGDVSTARLLLRSTDRVRFVPAAQWAGAATLSFTAWDRTAGVAGDRLDLASDAIGRELLTATLTVLPG
jgi:hypothetical protein